MTSYEDNFSMDEATSVYNGTEETLAGNFIHKPGDGSGDWTMSDTWDMFVKWEDNPLMYLFATFTLMSMLIWIGFAGDNLQHHRSYGSLSFAGGATHKQLWENSFGGGGFVLMVFRVAAFCFCLWFSLTQIIQPNVDAGNKVTDYMNFHDWSFYCLTIFFGLGAFVSVRGVFGGDGERASRYIGHSGDCNLVGHWLITWYSAAFTLCLACDLCVWLEMLFNPQCVGNTYGFKMSTLLDPASRLCYFEWNYMVGFVGNLILLLVESTLGQLPFPKCYLSTPLFILGLFITLAYLMHEFLFYHWPYEQLNFYRWQCFWYVNGFNGLVFGTHFFLNWFLSMGRGDLTSEDVGDEHIPLFKGDTA